MEPVFKQLALQVYQSISPTQLVQPTAVTQQVKEITLQLVSNLPIDFIEGLFAVRDIKEQAVYRFAVYFLFTDLSNTVQSYKEEVNSITENATVKQACIDFYTMIENPMVDLCIKLAPGCAEQLNMEANVKSAEQIHTSLSVSQLALFLRLQVDSGILQPDNINQLIKQTGGQYHTGRTHAISPLSLRNKFYENNAAAIAIMQAYLMNMLQLLKKYRSSYVWIGFLFAATYYVQSNRYQLISGQVSFYFEYLFCPLRSVLTKGL